MKKIKILGIGITIALLLTSFVMADTQTRLNEKKSEPANCSLQPPIEWEKTYGGDEADKFWDVQETDDGGYIASGTTDKEDNRCPWVVRVDAEGNEIWDWTITEFEYGGTSFDITNSWCDDTKHTTDGGYIVALSSLRFDYNDELHVAGGLLKLDSNGAEEWMQIFGESFEWTIAVEFIMEVEDGYMGVGFHSPPLVGSQNFEVYKDLCMFKTDNTGELIWHQEYDYKDESSSDARCFCCTNDGGYLIVGYTGEDVGDSYDGVMIKTDSNGNEEWHKTFGGYQWDSFWGVFQTNDGGYMVGGGTESFGAGQLDFWVVRTDATGNEMWNKTFGGSRYDTMYGGFDSTDDGGYIASVGIEAFGGMNADGWALKIDSNGNIEWKHVYGESGGRQTFIGICCTRDGGCISSGMSGPWDGRTSDALLVKFAPLDNQRPNKPSKPSGPARGQPGTEYTFTTSTTDPDGDKIYYLWDWGDGNYSDWLDTTEASYTWTGKDNYNIRIMAKDEHGGESDWSDPLSFSTPKNRIINPLFLRFLENHPHLFPMLRQILLCLR